VQERREPILLTILHLRCNGSMCIAIADLMDERTDKVLLHDMHEVSSGLEK